MKIFVKISLIILLVGYWTQAASQITQRSDHALSLATSNNAAMLLDAHSLYVNPAAILASQYKIDFTTSAVNRYNTDIFSLSGAVSFIFNEQSAVGLLVGSYGIDGFKENNAAISFTRTIGNNSYLAIQPSLYRLDIEGLGQRSSWDLTLGYWGRINDHWTLSAHTQNMRSFIGKEGDRQGLAQLGINYLLSDQAEIYTSLSYDSDDTWRLSPGILYRPHQILSLYISFNTTPSSIGFGTSIQVQDYLSVQLGYAAHPDLGSSLGLSLSYRIVQ